MFRRSSRLMKGRLANAALRVVGSGISWAARAIVLVVRVPLTRRSRSSSVSQVLAILAPYALFNPSFDDSLAFPPLGEAVFVTSPHHRSRRQLTCLKL